MTRSNKRSLSRAPTPSTSRAFFFVNVVWGEDYVKVFTDYSIPSLLAPGNIPSIASRSGSEFVIVTTAEDEEKIRASDVFPALSSHIDVCFIRIAATAEHKYDQMKRGHSLAVAHVARRGFCIFLAPDAIVSDGMIKRLDELANHGRRVVAGFGPRVNQLGFLNDLRALQARASSVLSVAPRALVELTVRHLHSDLLQHFVDSQHFPEQPYACLWRAPDGEGFLVRSLNLHPYLFDTDLLPSGEVFDWRTLTIDWNVMPRFVGDWNEFYVEKDSDNFCIVGSTPAAIRAKHGQPNTMDSKRLSLWILKHGYELLNRTSFLYALAFHTNPLTPAWDRLIEKTREFALEVTDPAKSLRGMTLLGSMSARSGRLDAANGGGMDNQTPPVTGTNSLRLEDAGEPIPFFYGFSVWGEGYVRRLCDFALPSLLSSRNLLAMNNNQVSSIVIATTPEDERLIRSSAIFDPLSELINVDFRYLPTPSAELPNALQRHEKYHVMSVGHGIAAEAAAGRGCAIFLGPDAIYSDGMLLRLYELVASGKSAVVGMGPRVCEETIVPQLVRSGYIKSGQPICIGPRDAVRLLLEHMHDDVRLLRWHSPFFGEPPYMVVWDVGGGDGLLLRCFNLHPYLVDYRKIQQWGTGLESLGAVDGTFLANCLIPWDRIHQVTDSDDFVVLSFTSKRHHDYSAQINADRFDSVRRSSRRPDMTMLNRAYFMNGIKFHIGELDPRWEQLERETLKIAYDALAPISVQEEKEDAIRVMLNQKDTEWLQRSRELSVIQLNQLFASGLSGVSGRLAAKVLARKLLRKFRLGK